MFTFQSSFISCQLLRLVLHHRLQFLLRFRHVVAQQLPDKRKLFNKICFNIDLNFKVTRHDWNSLLQVISFVCISQFHQSKKAYDCLSVWAYVTSNRLFSQIFSLHKQKGGLNMKVDSGSLPSIFWYLDASVHGTDSTMV